MYTGSYVPLTCGYPTRCLGAAGYAPDSSVARLRCPENGLGSLAAQVVGHEVRAAIPFRRRPLAPRLVSVSPRSGLIETSRHLRAVADASVWLMMCLPMSLEATAEFFGDSPPNVCGVPELEQST
jgi:hypothetical protein